MAREKVKGSSGKKEAAFFFAVAFLLLPYFSV
jgi:hypothetical protein